MAEFLFILSITARAPGSISVVEQDDKSHPNKEDKILKEVASAMRFLSTNATAE